MMQLSLKVNINLPVHQQATELYKQALQQLETPTKLPHPQFLSLTLQKLKSQIAEFGEVVKWEVPYYPMKKKPVLKSGSGANMLIATGLDRQSAYFHGRFW